VSQVVLSSLFSGPVTGVEIVLDQKTLARETRFLVINQLERIPEEVRNSLTRLRVHDPPAVDRLIQHLQFGARDCSIAWSDASGTDWAEGGLQLAHCLARAARRSYSGEERPSGAFSGEMQSHGYQNYDVDLTEQIIAPIHEETIQQWKRDTGLPEPRA
jgi:hypothetical protein